MSNDSPHDAMRKAVIAGCLSLRPSVTLLYCKETAQYVIKLSGVAITHSTHVRTNFFQRKGAKTNDLL